MSIKDSAQETANGWYSVTAHSIIRMELKDGTYHEDIGAGLAEGQSSMASILKIQAKEVTFTVSLKYKILKVEIWVSFE